MLLVSNIENNNDKKCSMYSIFISLQGGCATHSVHTCRGQSDYGKEIKQMLKVFLFVFLLLINEYRNKTRFPGDALHNEKDEGQGRRGGGDQRLEVRCHGDRQVHHGSRELFGINHIS